MNIDERYRSPNIHRVESLIPEYSYFLDEYLAAMATIGKYTGIRGQTLEEKAMLIEVIKTKELTEARDILEEMNEKLDGVLNYADERNGILVGIEKNILEDNYIGSVADTLDNTNEKIEYLRETIYNLFSDSGYSILHELTNDLKNEE